MRGTSQETDLEKQAQVRATHVTKAAVTAEVESTPFNTTCRKSQSSPIGYFVPSTDTALVESCAKGYPQAAAFLSSDRNFSLYRGYGFLRARLLLAHQQELAWLEEELDELDEDHARDPEKEIRLRSYNADVTAQAAEAAESEQGTENKQRSRQEILGEIKSKLAAYGLSR